MQARLPLALILAAVLAACVAAPANASSAGRCDRFASLSGSDGGSGKRSSPFRTVNRLVGSLRPGQTGCLRPGTYVENVRIARGGVPGRPIVLRSAGRRATVRGKFYVVDSAHDVVVARLRLDGRNDVGALASPIVNGDRIVFRRNDVTNGHTAICFILGNAGYGVAEGVVIDANRIHDCGELPATNMDHAIYVSEASGTRITNNWIYDNADRGVQLYPDAQGTLVAHNLIDGNGVGVIFSGAGGRASNGNRVVRNIISNATARHNIESWYPPGNPVGEGNLVARNCLWNGRGGDIGSRVGFRAVGNIFADPGFVNRGAKDFRLRPGSRCARMGPRR